MAQKRETGKRESEPSAKEEEGGGPPSRVQTGAKALKGELTELAGREHQVQERRSRMAVDETKAERAQEDYKEMAKTWKTGYLGGLEAFLQWQAQNERLFKDTVKQQLSGSRQLLTMWRDWMNRQTEEQQRTQERTQGQFGGGNGTANPVFGFTRQSTEAVVTTVEPLLKTSEAAMDSTFGYYESAVGAPSRRYVREINKQVLDAVIPS
jgi:hypothetical protein